MTKAFVMVGISPGKFNNWGKTVRENIENIPSVSEAYCVLGSCDIVAKIESGSSDNLSKTVVDEIKNIEGVEDTEVLVMAEEE